MLVDTVENYTEILEQLQDEKALVVDVETNGLDSFGHAQICGIGIGKISNDETYYFPMRHQQGTNLPHIQTQQLIAVLNTCPVLIGYNIKFDLHFLEKEGLGVQKKRLEDVIVMVRLTEPTQVRDLDLTSTLKRSYGESAAQYDIETKKYLRSNKWNKDFSLAPPDVLGEYCEKDVHWTRRLYRDRLGLIHKSQQEAVWELEVSLTPVLYAMENRGISVDTEYAQTAIEKILSRKEELKEKIYAIVGEFNINSTQQLGAALNEQGIFSPESTPKGAQSWGEAALVKIDHPVAGYIRQYRTLEKLRSTYLEPHLEESVIHTGFCNWGTVTGRLSSREPNLQNIPRNHFKLTDIKLTEEERLEVLQRVNAILAAKGDAGVEELKPEVLDTWSFIGDESYDESVGNQIAIRRLFKPRENYYLVGFDYSQMEVRVFLSYLQNEEIQNLLRKTDVDFHGEAAKLAFGVEEDSSEFKFYRQMAKAITFGTIYGIGNKKLAIQLGTTPREAGQYKRRYFEGLKGSKGFFDSVVKTVETRGWIKNRYGRVYRIPADMGYKGINYLVQGTSADILNERLIEVSRALEETQSKVLLQVHDEIICEIHEDEITTLPAQITELLKENSLNIPLQVDMELCDPTWATKTDMNKAVFSSPVATQTVEDYIDWE